MLVKYCFWTTGKYRMRSVIHVLLRWITNFFLASTELCRTVVRKSSISVFTFVEGGLASKTLTKNFRFVVLVILIWGAWSFVLGGLAHKAPLVATGMKLCSGRNMFFDIVRNDKQLHIIQMYDFWRLHLQWRNWRGEENRPTWQASCKNWPSHKLIFHFSILLVFSRLLLFCVFRGIFRSFKILKYRRLHP